MKPDLELEAWREQWQTDTEVPADLRRKVERGSRNMRLMLAADVLVTVVIGGGTILWAVLEPTVEMRMLAAVTWMFLAAAWTFAMSTRRGTWSPAASTTREFVELSIRRCRGKLAASRFGIWLYFVEIVFCLSWLYREPARRTPWPVAIFAIATPVVLVAMRRYKRNAQRELEGLEELQGSHEL